MKPSTAGLAVLLAVAAGCGSVPEYQRTPTAAVEAFFENLALLKSAATDSGRAALESGEGETGEVAEATRILKTLVSGSRRAKALFAAWLLVDIEEFEVLGEDIDGDRAEVSVRYRVSGMAGHGFQWGAEAEPEVRPAIVRLRRRGGRWVLTDLGRSPRAR